MLLGISGKKCAGKDTTCARLLSQVEGQRFAFADPLKDEAIRMVAKLTGDHITREMKDPRVRALYQKLGEAGRAYDSDIWVNYTLRQAQRYRNQYQGAVAVITDVRYPNEVEKIEALGGLVVRCSCPDSLREARARALYGEGDPALSQHSSEIALDFWPFQMYIDTTSQLTAQSGIDVLVRMIRQQRAESAL